MGLSRIGVIPSMSVIDNILVPGVDFKEKELNIDHHKASAFLAGLFRAKGKIHLLKWCL